MSRPQVRAATRKWIARAMNFLHYARNGQTKRADEYLTRFKRSGKLADALVLVQAAGVIR